MFRSQVTCSARSVVEAAGPGEPAGTSARGRGCGAPTGRQMASEARIFSSWTYLRTLIARRRAVSAHTECGWAGPRAIVITITSFVVSGLAIRPCLLDRPPMRSGDVRAMEDGWISCRIRANPGSRAGRWRAGQGWRTQLPPIPSPGVLCVPRNASTGSDQQSCSPAVRR